jgi:arylesterase / paraoxonase
MAKKILLVVAVLVVAVLGRVGYKVAQASGQFTKVETVHADTCSTVAAAPGPEDLVIDHATGFAYIAATDRRMTDPRPRGSIYMLDLNDHGSVPVEVLGDNPNDFFSHGVSLWRGSDGALRLFAVNHPETGETVEIFDVAEDGQLQHAETIRSEVMHSLNDVVAVGPRQFYATNDQRFDGGIGGALEVFLGLPLGDLVYFNGEDAVIAASGFAYANGVNVSLDGQKIYVAETIGHNLAVFDRDPGSGELSSRRDYGLSTGADNIDVAPDGSLFIGAHPDLLAFTAHAGDPETISPSQVVRFDPANAEFATVYASLDGELNGSATGAYWKGTLLVSGVFDADLARCEIQ